MALGRRLSQVLTTFFTQPETGSAPTIANDQGSEIRAGLMNDECSRWFNGGPETTRRGNGDPGLRDRIGSSIRAPVCPCNLANESVSAMRQLPISGFSEEPLRLRPAES